MIHLARLAALLIAIGAIATAQTPLANLHPHPKSAFPRPGTFSISASTPIVVVGGLNSTSQRSGWWLQKQLASLVGSTLSLIEEPQYDRNAGIIVAQLGESSTFDALLGHTMPAGEPLPAAGGYIIDVSAARVLLIGADAEGVDNAIATFRQMVASNGSVNAAHIWDYPDFPVRWVFNQQNLRGTNAIGTLRKILDTMSSLKLNAIQQNDFKYSILASQPAWYFDSVRAYRALSHERSIGIVPGVAGIGYSEGILWHDANLAEGLHATTRYVIEADTGRILSDPRVTLPNGGFESVGGNGKFTGWSFYDDGSVTVDRSIVHSGAASARATNFVAGNPSGNCRFSRAVQCNPHSAYLMTAWMRTEALTKGELRLLAIGTVGNTSRVLTYTAFALPATSSGWLQVQVVFNTLEYTQMNVYAGLWGGETGTFWIDDFEIRDNGLANVLRRDGTPLHVQSPSGSKEYREGTDFAPVVDTRMANGVYPWHQPPTFRRLANGTLGNGDTVDISYFHPISTYGDQNGIGQVMVCVSDDTLYTILEDQFRRVDTLYSPRDFFMNHDEIRVMNQDSACLSRNMTPAQLLGDNVTRCAALIDSVHPGATVFTWSDMFDSLHNATNNYYLINGDLRGVWDMIPKDVVIANWNNGEMQSSLAFFSEHGFKQIAAPYYDERDTRNIREWRLALGQTIGALGMMYTTWAADYSYLRPFAYYAWGAGPYIIHVPLDSIVLATAANDSIRIEAQIYPDPYDATDRIIAAQAIVETSLGQQIVALVPQGNNVFVGNAIRMSNSWFSYSIKARNAQGIDRATPQYQIPGLASATSERSRAIDLAARVYPNPVGTSGTVMFIAPESAPWAMSVVDALGRVVHTSNGWAVARQQITLALDSESWARGAYRCEIHCGAARSVVAVVAQ